MLTFVKGEFLTEIRPGIYKEEIGEVAMLKRQAELWIQIDLTELDTDLKIIEEIGRNLSKLCRNSSLPRIDFKKDCQEDVKITMDMLDTIRMDYDNMLQVKREKRSVYMEYGLKILIGSINFLMNGHLDSKLRAISENKNFHFELTKLVETTVSQLKTAETIKKHSKTLDMINEEVNILKNNLNSYDFEVQAGFSFTNMMSRFRAIYFTTNNKIRDIHQTIIDLQSDVFNSKIITSKTIGEALKQIKIPDELQTWPVNLDDPDLTILREISKYAVLLIDNKLIIVYTIPLREIGIGKIQKFYAIPKLNGNIASFLNISTNYIISDKNLNKFLEWNQIQLQENCVKIENTFYCKNMNVMNREFTTCTYKLITGLLNELKRACGVKVLKLENTTLIKTNDDNKYIALSPVDLYGNLIFNDETILLHFIGTQILEINQQAKLRLQNLEFDFFAGNNIVKTKFQLKNFTFIDSETPENNNCMWQCYVTWAAIIISFVSSGVGISIFIYKKKDGKNQNSRENSSQTERAVFRRNSLMRSCPLPVRGRTAV